jgi:hypothetical protein
MIYKSRNTFKVELFGGIGNQLFQFAAGMYLQERFNQKANFTSWRVGFEDRLPREIVSSGPSYLRNPSLLLEKLLSRMTYLRRIEVKFLGIHESKKIGYDPELEKGIPNRRLRGYFQTFRFADYLKKETAWLTFTEIQESVWLKAKLSEIKAKKVIAIHLRRGDYRNNPQIGLLETNYYRGSLNELTKLEIFGELWIFSDDSTAAEALGTELNREFVVVGSDPDSTDFETLILMSKANAIIMANSTFSWWASFLASENTTVITPTKWFKGAEDPIDLSPPHWIRVKSTWEDEYDGCN